LSRYRELLDESVVMKDLHKIRYVTEYAHARPHLLADYPRLLADAAHEYLTVDATSKKDKQLKILRMLVATPKRRLINDALGALRALS
jgi:hypothetical protein